MCIGFHSLQSGGFVREIGCFRSYCQLLYGTINGKKTFFEVFGNTNGQPIFTTLQELKQLN